MKHYCQAQSVSAPGKIRFQIQSKYSRNSLYPLYFLSRKSDSGSITKYKRNFIKLCIILTNFTHLFSSQLKFGAKQPRSKDFCRKIELQSNIQEIAALPAVKSSEIAAEWTKKEYKLSQIYLKLIRKSENNSSTLHLRIT